MLLPWAIAAALAGALVSGPSGPEAVTTGLVIVASVLLVIPAVRPVRLSSRAVLAASTAVVALAVVVPAHGSRDLWSYAMYGRIVTTHHASPYVHRPDEYGTDPYLARVRPGWRHTRSVYGPVFTGLSAAFMAVAGSHPLVARLLFQATAAGAVLAALFIVDRRTRDPVATAWVGLHPAVVLYAVNGGHNDALIGLAIIGATILAVRDRPGWAGLTLGAAAMVKVVAVLPLAGLAAWTWFRRGPRPAARLVAVAVAIVAVALVAGGGLNAVRPLSETRSLRSRASPWALPLTLTNLGVLPHSWHASLSRTLAPSNVSTAAGIVVLFVAVLLTIPRVREREATAATTAALVAYLLLAPYALPWYLVWVVPALVLMRRDRLARVAGLYTLLVVLAYEYRPDARHDVLEGALRWVVAGVQLVAIAAAVALVVHAIRDLVRRPGAGTVTARRAPKDPPARVGPDRPAPRPEAE